MVILHGVVSCGVFWLSSVVKKARVTVYDDVILLKKWVSCETYFHVNIQMICFIVCHLFCSVPAYRGRKLPYVFNEAMLIVYTSFICILSFAVSFPIRHFQKSLFDKALTHWVVFLVNNMVVVFLLYVSKCFVIVWKPKKNTREYFRSKTTKIF